MANKAHALNPQSLKLLRASDAQRYGKKMKRVITHLIVLICAATPVLGQEFFEAEHGAQPNHLEPVSPDFSNYRKRIADHLLVTPADHGLMIARPSFSGESAVAIYEKISKEVLAKHDNLVVLFPNDEKSFFITYTQANESLWYSMADNDEQKKEKKVDIQRHDLQISSSLAIAIQRAWGRMLIRTKYPEKAYMGLDGITYEFGVFVRGLGFLQGEIWTPDSGLPAKLAELGGKLQKIASEGKPLTPEQEKELLKELSQFERLATKP